MLTPLPLALLAVLTLQEFTPQLPVPSGPHALGTSVHVLEDPTRTYAFEPLKARQRELVFQLWYPAEPSKASPREYLPDLAQLEALQRAHYLELGEEVLGAWADLVTHARERVPPAGGARFPLLLFLPGLGVARVSYTALCEELASHGWIVAAIDPPYLGLSLFPDGRVLTSDADPRGPEASGTRVDELARDASCVLDHLLAGEWAERIDRERLGVLGHSLGGAAALEACRLDARLRAAVDLDGHPFGGAGEHGIAGASLVVLNQPERSKRPPAHMARERHAVWEELARKGSSPLHLVTIEDTDHFTFSDVPFVVPPAIRARSGAVLDPGRGHALLSRLLRAYLGAALDVPGSETLAAVARDHAEVTLETLGG